MIVHTAKDMFVDPSWPERYKCLIKFGLELRTELRNELR